MSQRNAHKKTKNRFNETTRKKTKNRFEKLHTHTKSQKIV